MKKVLLSLALGLLMSCTSLTYHEQQELSKLQYKGVNIDRPAGEWQKPASPLAAGLLNILPGFGNFYLGCGNAGQSEQVLYGFLNLLTWPISIVWGIPEAAIDANTINKRDMLMYYQYNDEGKKAYAEVVKR